MSPLFSALVAAVLAGLFALVAYAVLRIIRRKAVPFLSIVGVVVGGGTGAAFAVLVLAPFYARKTIEGAEILFYLSSIVIAAIVCSIVALKFVERLRT